MIKKITAAAVALCLMGTAAGAQRYLCDGGIALSGSLDGIYVGSDITLSVIDADYTMGGLHSGNNSGAIAYYGEFTAAAENRYDLAFALSQSGEYRAYIGVASKPQPAEVEFEYINQSANTAAINSIISPGANIESILTVSRKDLGLFTKAYNVASLQNAAVILGASLPQSGTPTCDEMIVLGEKALLASALNSGSVADIAAYSDVFEKDAVMPYIGVDNKAAVTTFMSGKNIATVTAFDNMLTEAAIVSLANQPTGSGMLKNALTAYAAKYSIPVLKITADLCSAMTLQGGFASIGDITSYISGYNLALPPQQAGGGGGGGNAFMSQTVTPPANIEKPREEYSVFTDLDSVPWAKTAITQLYYKGIVSGKTDTEFYPQDTVKREEFAKLITSAYNINLVNEEIPFTDVPKEHWSYSYVRSAYLAGIARGITDTIFGLGMDIKRQDLCVMVYNALNACDITLEAEKDAINFADKGEISDYALSAVEALSRAGVVSGDENGYFNPHASATRAEAAVIIYGLIK